jgi:hypothetical protein
MGLLGWIKGQVKDKVKEVGDDATGGAVSEAEDAKEGIEDAKRDVKDLHEALHQEKKDDDD